MQQLLNNSIYVVTRAINSVLGKTKYLNMRL